VKFLLDTNVVSELRRPHRTNPNVAAWADAVPPSDMFLSSITILELETGALLLKRRDDRQGGLIQQWIEDRVLPAFYRAYPRSRRHGCAAMCGAPCPRSEALQGFVDRGDRVGPWPHRRDPKPG
jgi:hypothetical protein